MSENTITKVYSLKSETVYKNEHVNAVDVCISYNKGDYHLKRGYYLSINPSLHNGCVCTICPLDGVLIHLEDTKRFSRKRLEALANEANIRECVYHYFPEFVGNINFEEVFI